MNVNKALDNILELLDAHQLGKAIDSMENYLLMHPRQQDMERLTAIRDDYRRMADYWLQGYDDPQRQTVGKQLAQRLCDLTYNVYATWRLNNSAFLKALYLRPRSRQQGWSVDTIKAEMETFVSNITLLQLESEQLRRQKSEQLHRQHCESMRDLFDYILTSRQWRPTLADSFIELLLSPTLFSQDQQLIVSAITLSAMLNFCRQKFRVLAEVCLSAADEYVRQRALVGWAVLLYYCGPRFVKETAKWVERVCNDERTSGELTELQMQLVYCLKTDADTNIIQETILPEIIKNNPVGDVMSGLENAEESRLEDIIHPEASEEKIERLEQNINRMMELQKQGADIYFGGFSQMKRFPFFNDVANWFVPFFPQHPGISKIWNNTRGKVMLKAVTRKGTFCNSDKYSLVLAFDQVVDRLPKDLLKVIEESGGTLSLEGEGMTEEEQSQPAFIRRSYLQDLYRFFRLFSARGEFDNLFDADTAIGRMLFFENPLLSQESLRPQFSAVARFLMKYRCYNEVVGVLNNMPRLEDDLQACLMMGIALTRAKNNCGHSSEPFFRRVLELDPDNGRALAGLARERFSQGDYEQALGSYRRLIEIQPDHRGYQLNAAVCYFRLGRSEEALEILYRLSYLDDGDSSVKRVLAWVLTIGGKYEQAATLYQRLLDDEHCLPADLQNYGYNQWLSRNIVAAVDLFRRYVGSCSEARTELESAFEGEEHELLSKHGIGDVEIRLMLDAVDAP